jgi:hypothetical protein
MSPSRQKSGWSPERRAAQSAMMSALNGDPDFVARRRKGQSDWSPERRAAKSAELTARNFDPDFHRRKLEGIAERPRRGFAVPERCHPCVRGLFVEMNEQQATRAEVGSRAGVNTETLSTWRGRSMPLLDVFDAVLNALDLELAIVPIGTRDRNGMVRRKPRTAKSGDAS